MHKTIDAVNHEFHHHELVDIDDGMTRSEHSSASSECPRVDEATINTESGRITDMPKSG